ncbi:MAG: DUF2786 domain-containing protein [Candidatus Competibacteraceae bacterium]|nr:DUF2786 domain-containing protein [Candidatus Competibacteraceae bacterium]
MTFNNRDRLLEKIQSLIRKGEDPAATGPERDAFLAKASELMEQYKIELYELENRGNLPSESIDAKFIPWADIYYEVYKTPNARKTVDIFVGSLASTVAPVFYCRGLVSREAVLIAGRPSDIELAVLALKKVYFSIEMEMLAKRAGYKLVKGSQHGGRMISGVELS